MRFDPVTRNDNLFKNYKTLKNIKKRDDTFLDTYWLERRIEFHDFAYHRGRRYPW